MSERLELRVSINPNLDLDPLRADFTAKGRLHVTDFLTKVSIKALLEALEEDIPWNMVFNKGEKHFDLHPPQLEAMTKEQTDQLQQTIYAQAQQGFQYWYNNYPVHDAVKSGNHPGLRIHGIDDFLNSDTFLQFVRDVSGVEDVDYADCQATAYGPCHFLTSHDDGILEKKRQLAYVINLTPFWKPDWGGALVFYDENGNISEGFLPHCNCINIFRVPAPHAVQIVAPFAGARRLSITGWVRSH